MGTPIEIKPVTAILRIDKLSPEQLASLPRPLRLKKNGSKDVAPPIGIDIDPDDYRNDREWFLEFLNPSVKNTYLEVDEEGKSVIFSAVTKKR